MGFFNQGVLRTGGAVLRIIETTGAKGNKPSLTVGNGLCAVPLRGKYNLCKQTGTTSRYVIPSERSESRNLPKLQIYLVVVYYPTWWIPPLRLRSRPE